MSRTRIKFCGMQSEADVQAAIALGVDAVGFIFAPSPRRIALDQAERLAALVPPLVSLIGVWVNPTRAEFAEIQKHIPQAIAQFCGDETPEYCEELSAGRPYLKVIHIPTNDDDNASMNALQRAEQYRGLSVFDTQSGQLRGGSGQAFDWSRLSRPQRPFVLAGGLQSENVGAGTVALRPYAVDVRSGIEVEGRKDQRRMAAFVAAVRAADEEIAHATR